MYKYQNINHHLDTHENDKRYSKWRDLFKANTPHKAILSDEVFKLVKLLKEYKTKRTLKSLPIHPYP